MPKVPWIQTTKLRGAPNTFMPVAAKQPDYFGDISLTNAIFKKIFEAELFIRTLSTAPIQIFCEFMLYSKMKSKSMKSPDNTCQVYLQARMV